MTASDLQNRLKNKNVVFITVKNRDYIRVTQLERLLKQEASSYIVYSSEKGNPITRALDINRRIKNIDFSGADVVILGFLPQLIYKSAIRRIRNAQKEDVQPFVIADFFLSLYDTIVLDRKLVSQNWLIAKMLRKMDSEVLKGADLVITDTQADADFFADEFGADKKKFEVLYLEADSNLFSSGNSANMGTVTKNSSSGNIDDIKSNQAGNEHSSGKNSCEKGGIREVLYFGTGLPLQGTDIVLNAFLQVAEVDGIKCTYIGGTKGVSKKLLKKVSDCQNVELISWLSQEQLSKRIESAGLCIAGNFNPDIDKADRTIPGKAYIYEAMNKPMILGDTRANHELFSPDERHIFVPRGDNRALAKAIAVNL